MQSQSDKSQGVWGTAVPQGERRSPLSGPVSRTEVTLPAAPPSANIKINASVNIEMRHTPGLTRHVRTSEQGRTEPHAMTPAEQIQRRRQARQLERLARAGLTRP